MIRLLLIDDDPLILLAAGAALRATGEFAVREASTGEDALRLAAEDPPDVVVSDVQLPDITGPDLLARLREGPLTRHVKLIVLTSRTRPEDAERFRVLGVRGVVAKPIDLATFPDEIGRLLRD